MIALNPQLVPSVKQLACTEKRNIYSLKGIELHGGMCSSNTAALGMLKLKVFFSTTSRRRHSQAATFQRHVPIIPELMPTFRRFGRFSAHSRSCSSILRATLLRIQKVKPCSKNVSKINSPKNTDSTPQPRVWLYTRDTCRRYVILICTECRRLLPFRRSYPADAMMMMTMIETLLKSRS